MKNFLFYIAFTFLALSCSNHSDDQDFDRTLNCNTDKPVQTMSEYVSHVSFAVLDSDSEANFRNIDKLVIDNERIYIGDFSSQKIVAYKMDGSLDFVLDKKGRGPGEYLSMKSYCVYDNNLYILDNNGSKIHVYTADKGSFKESVNLPFVSWDFEALGNGGFIFAFAPMKGGRLKSAQPLYRIFLTDKDLHIKGKMFGYAESDYDLIAYSRFFSVYDDKIVYSSFHFDGFTVFDRFSGEVVETVGIKFSHAIPGGLRKDDSVTSASYNFLESVPILCGQYILAEISLGDYTDNFMYDPAISSFVTNSESSEGNYVFYPIGSWKDCYVSYISDKELYSGLVESGLERAPQDVEMALDSGNPVLIFYHMK